jgi:hypothetical protein
MSKAFSPHSLYPEVITRLAAALSLRRENDDALSNTGFHCFAAGLVGPGEWI